MTFYTATQKAIAAKLQRIQYTFSDWLFNHKFPSRGPTTFF
ncbi:hypothetical protein DWUX_614 [Desulfovibrio diazotrophicus]|nr:hypothetical protein DWUX_614 [Desulfovibrio diazotrophicus]VVU42699.1 hypothetical protein DWUX_45 [Desulfovibrio diazotrophicus]